MDYARYDSKKACSQSAKTGEKKIKLLNSIFFFMIIFRVKKISW